MGRLSMLLAAVLLTCDALAGYKAPDPSKPATPENPIDHYNRGNDFKAKGDLHKAVEEYQQAISLQPTFAQAYVNLGITYGQMDYYDQAITNLDKAIFLNPQIAEAFFNRGFAWAQKGNAEKALADYQQATVIDPKMFVAPYNMAKIYDKLGKSKEAIAAYKRFLEIAPAECKTQIALARERLRALGADKQP